MHLSNSLNKIEYLDNNEISSIEILEWNKIKTYCETENFKKINITFDNFLKLTIKKNNNIVSLYFYEINKSILKIINELPNNIDIIVLNFCNNEKKYSPPLSFCSGGGFMQLIAYGGNCTLNDYSYLIDEIKNLPVCLKTLHIIKKNDYYKQNDSFLDKFLPSIKLPFGCELLLNNVAVKL
jgi:hypothetical protein